MSVEKDLQQITLQERELRFTEFSAETAWEVGSRLRAAALQRKAGMTFEVQVAGRVLFYAATLDASQGQAEWIRRKRNTVMRFSKSSYAIGLELVRDGKSFEEKHELSKLDHAAHGGAFPILLRGTGVVGSVIASGLKQREDHDMVVAVLAEVLGVELASVALTGE